MDDYWRDHAAEIRSRTLSKISAAGAGGAAVAAVSGLVSGRHIGRGIPAVAVNCAAAMALLCVGQETLRWARGGAHDAWTSAAAGGVTGAVLVGATAGPQYRLLGAVLWAPLCGAGHALHEALQPGQYMRALLLEAGLLDPSPAVQHQQGAVQVASGASSGTTVEAAGAEAAAAALKEATAAAAAAAVGGDGGAAAGVGSMEAGGDTILNNSSNSSGSDKPWWHELLPTHMQQQQHQAPYPTPASSSCLEAGQSTPGQPRTVDSLTKRELRLFAEEIKQREMAALHAAWREEEAAARRAEAVALAESYKQKQQQQTQQGEGEQGAGGAAGGSSRRPWWRLW